MFRLASVFLCTCLIAANAIEVNEAAAESVEHKRAKWLNQPTHHAFFGGHRLGGGDGGSGGGGGSYPFPGGPLIHSHHQFPRHRGPFGALPGLGHGSSHFSSPLGGSLSHGGGMPMKAVSTKTERVARSCKFELPDGEAYDFSPLTLKSGDSPYMGVDKNRNTYKINVCGTDTTPGSDCARQNGMICQYRSGRHSSQMFDSYNLKMEGIVARWGMAPFPSWSYIDPSHKSTGIKMMTANGDDCEMPSGQKPRQAAIYFVCDKDAGAIGNLQVQEVATCQYVFTIPSKYACPGMAGMSAGWVFIIVLLFVSSCYCCIGVLFNRIQKKKEGTEAIPNIEFWRDLPALVKDGCNYSFNFVSCYAFGKKTDDDL